MLKYLLICILALIVWWAWRAPRRQERAVPPRNVERDENMVACARCGVYLPASEALPGPRGTYFCSSQHREG